MCVRHTVFPVQGAPQIYRAPGCCLVIELCRKLEIAPNFASLQSMGGVVLWCSTVSAVEVELQCQQIAIQYGSLTLTAWKLYFQKIITFVCAKMLTHRFIHA